ENVQHGIFAGNDCRIVNNLCCANGAGGTGSGIYVNEADTHIDGNTSNDNDIGIEVTVGGCMIRRNVATGNTTYNWSIKAGNALAPIVNASTNASDVNGNSTTGVSLGSTDPNANFTY
ncbi:MAG TPA: hypothetical protein VNT79_13210, partial [Phycisphaerae bacterium]|nr:hypothetical protein [Phycisphaerae bacterium]